MRKALRITAAGLVVGLMLSLAGCGNGDVVAKVNGEPIKKQAIDEQLAQIKQQYPQMFQGPDAEARETDFRRRLLDTLIQQELLRQAAEESDIKVTDDEVEKQVAELRKGFQGDDQFNEALAQSGMTVEKLNEQVRDQLVTQRLIEKLSTDMDISDKDVKAYYDANKAQFKDQSAVHAWHILFDQNDKATAEKVLARIKRGEDFATLAKKYSKDEATAQKGGDLGWPQTPYVQEFQAAADKLAVGEVSDLVKTPFGWHIIKVEERRKERQKPLADVEEQIRQILVQQQQADAYQKYIDELRSKADIEILDETLKTAEPVEPSQETTK